jgi:hypothetical protein
LHVHGTTELSLWYNLLRLPVAWLTNPYNPVCTCAPRWFQIRVEMVDLVAAKKYHVLIYL